MFHFPPSPPFALRSAPHWERLGREREKEREREKNRKKEREGSKGMREVEGKEVIEGCVRDEIVNHG